MFTKIRMMSLFLPDEYYPPWVMDLARPPMKAEEMGGNAAWGMTLPLIQDQRTMMNKVRRQMKFKLPNRLRMANASWELKWENKPEGTENNLDNEWGDLPQIIERYAMEETKDEGSRGASQASSGNIFYD